MAYQFSGNALGPVWGPNQMLVTQQKDGETYQLNIFPDYFNDKLRDAGKPMYFYYQPDKPRLAQYDDGTYKFNFVKFEGVLNADDNIDSPGAETEVAGGLLSFTTTLKIPDDVIAAAIQQLKNNCMNDAKYSADNRWMYKDGMPDPNLGVVPIVANLCAVSSMGQTGSKPGTGDDPWLCQVEGTNYDTAVKDDKGNVVATGSTNPTGENAFTIMLGQYPAVIIEQAMKGASLPIYVTNRLQHMFYMDAFTANIHADYNMCYTYVSGELKADYTVVKSDVQASYSSLSKQGALAYSITMNSMILTADQEKTYQAQSDKVFDKITDWFLKTMVDSTPAKPDPAKAPDPSGCGGVSLGLKVEHDTTQQDLDFNEEISDAYLPYNPISADICGMMGKMGNTPESMNKYFQIVHLDQAFVKIHFVAKANAFWPSAPGKDDGDPINSISLEVQYPDSTGTLTTHSAPYMMVNDSAAKTPNPLGNAIWDATNKDAIFIFEFPRLDTDSDASIDRNTIYLRSTVTYDADPRVEIPGGKVVGPNTTTDRTDVVTADPVGTLRISPILLDTVLPAQVQVKVTIMKANRQPEALLFNATNQNVLQSYLAFTAESRTSIRWSYQVQVIVEGKFPKPSLNWSGPVIECVGSGPFVVSLPDVPDNLASQVGQYLSS